MNDWALVFLGIIAFATLTSSVIQIVVLVAAGRLARRVDRLASQVEQDLRPVFGHLNAIGRDASRAASLAVAQVERADRVLGDLAERVEQTVRTVQAAVSGPAREGSALLAGLRAAFSVLREVRARRAGARAEDEDALFI